MTPVRTLLGALLAICLAASAACGLSTNDSPEALARDNLPDDLGGVPETLPPVPGGTEGVPVELWFMETSAEPALLAPLQDRVPRNPTPKIVLETLFANDDLAESKLRSAIPTGTRTVGNPTMDDGVLVLDLPESFYNGLVETDGRYAYGQIVLTMAENNFDSDIRAVQFMLEGREKAVSVGDGAERVSGRVTASDYNDLRVGAP